MKNNNPNHPFPPPKQPLVKELREGFKASWPICLGYFPTGLALGVLAQQAGLPWWAVLLMSMLVFAGSAQFICVAMLASGASLFSIIATTFVVNLRHALMSSTLAIHLQNVNRCFLSLFAYGITDESFAVNMIRFKDQGWTRWSAIGVNQLSNLVWIISTVLGTVIGQFIPQGMFGIDYALTAMFICLLCYQLQGRVFFLTAIATALIALLWYVLIPGDSYIVGASIGGATLGFYIKRWKRSNDAVK
ncbi:MAG: branched-chain amino acid ABC transporter permease [Desulfobulbus propionicus]|nr:MAG: branched-chain amino acid ABC transporter permease [Desulfobulbus propionicus]